MVRYIKTLDTAKRRGVRRARQCQAWRSRKTPKPGTTTSIFSKPIYEQLLSPKWKFAQNEHNLPLRMCTTAAPFWRQCTNFGSRRGRNWSFKQGCSLSKTAIKEQQNPQYAQYSINLIRRNWYNSMKLRLFGAPFWSKNRGFWIIRGPLTKRLESSFRDENCALANL